MITTSLQRIIDATRIHTPGALDGVINMELFNTAKDFFARTNSWLEDIPINIEPGAIDYVLVSKDHGFINRLMDFYVPQTDAYNNIIGRFGAKGTLIKPAATGAILRVRDIPQIEAVWIATFALTVADPTDEHGIPILPDFLAEKYLEGFTSGIVSRLMMHPQKPYSSQQGSMFHGKKYLVAVSQCKNDIRQQNLYSAQRWAFPQTFRSHTQRTW